MPYGHDLAVMAKLVGDDTRVVFVANPNNPTGTWLKRDALESFVDAMPQSTLIVIDEAYCEYVHESDYPDAVEWVGQYPNVIVTRTFSKIYGLAGLRIGYGVSHPQIADVLNRVRQPFNVNSLAQVAALAALEDSEHVERSVLANSHGLGQLTHACKERGLRYIPSVVRNRTHDHALSQQGLVDGHGLSTHVDAEEVAYGRDITQAAFLAGMSELPQAMAVGQNAALDVLAVL